MIMTHVSPRSELSLINSVNCAATLTRLIGNLNGFMYRRRHDARWTMEFVSGGCRDITGYDPHRFIANASIAFVDLIARSDWKRVNERVRVAALHRRRVTIEYLIRTASGAWVQVEDRLTPIVNSAGKILAIEGVIDRARGDPDTTSTTQLRRDDSRLAALCTSPFSN